ncbi:MAG: Ig-like domain-containing protein, partial [bacterium]
LTWNNVGPLATNGAASATNILVRFEALAAGVGTNYVVTAPTTTNQVPVPPMTNSVPHTNSAPQMAVTKQILTPVSRPAAIGETVQFRITVSNTGPAPIFHVPVADQYNTNLLLFTSATPAGYSAATPGLVAWADVGPLGVASNWTAELSFKALTNGSDRNYAVSLVTNSVPHTNVNPRVSIAKAVTLPAGRPTAVGETNLFTITVRNTGDTVLDTVPVVDTYDAALLRFVSSVPGPSTNDPGRLTWNNVGPLATNGAASATNILVRFEALRTGVGTNWVFTAPSTTNQVPVPPMTNSRSHTAFSPGFTVAKTLLSPLAQAAQIGELVVFRIAVANTGDVDLVKVPVVDTYESYLTYVSSSVPPSMTTPIGTLTWTNVGPLAASASTNLIVTFRASIGTDFLWKTNTVTTAPTTPTNQPSVAPQTSRAPYIVDESIDVDNVSTGAFNFVASGSVPHTVLGNSTNHVLVVGISVNNSPEARGTVTNVLYGATPLTLAGSRTNDDKVVSMWVMNNPPVGTANVFAKLTRPPGEGWVVGAMTFRNVDQTIPYGMFSSSVGNSGGPVITGISSAMGEVIVDTVALQCISLAATGSGQTQRWTTNSVPKPGYASGGGSTKAGAASVSMSWTATYGSSSNWAMGALALKPHQTILKAPSYTEVSSSKPVSAVGEAVTFTASVTNGTGAVTVPTGTVQFKIDGLNFGCAVALVGETASSAAISSLTDGPHTITAEYSGDEHFNISTSDILQTVGSQAATLVITAIRIQDGHAVVEWPGTSTWFYTVLTTPSLSPLVPWSNLVSYVDKPGVNGPMSATDTNSLSKARFYRVKMNQ